MDDIKLENRVGKHKMMCVGLGLIGLLLTNPHMTKIFNLIENWAFPKEIKYSTLYIENEYRIREYLLYEIRAPYNSSFGLWYDNEIEWFKGKSQPLEIGKKIFTYLNKTAHNVDPFKLKEGDRVRVADLNKDGRLMGILITDLMVQGNARRISANAIMGFNSELYWENYHEQKNTNGNGWRWPWFIYRKSSL